MQFTNIFSRHIRSGHILNSKTFQSDLGFFTFITSDLEDIHHLVLEKKICSSELNFAWSGVHNFGSKRLNGLFEIFLQIPWRLQIFQSCQYFFLMLRCPFQNIFKLYLRHLPLSKIFHYMAYFFSGSFGKDFC